jgi:hypothetical protein
MGKPKLKVVGGPAKREAPGTPEERRYFADLHKIIDAIFEEGASEFDWTWNQLAAHADLTYATVSNLGERITQFPRFQTVYKLAHAVGWKLITQMDPKQNKKASAAKVKVVAG